MSRGKRRYLLALVESCGGCKQCGHILPERWMHYCGAMCRARWLKAYRERMHWR